MESIIYCFSGRGNSLSAARGLAERLPGTGVVPLADVEGEIPVGEGPVGLALPVIDIGLPGIVRRFVKRLRPAGKAPYVYAIITCGGMPGGSMQQLAKLLKRQGLELAAGWTLVFGLEPWQEGDWHMKLDEIAGAVRQQTPLPPAVVAFKDAAMTGLLNPLARLMIPNEDSKFRVAESCDGCGTCARICPVHDIEIRDGKPVWLHHCEQCAACFSWCPKAAISGSCLAARTHYTNPRIRLNQMLMKGGVEG